MRAVDSPMRTLNRPNLTPSVYSARRVPKDPPSTVDAGPQDLELMGAGSIAGDVEGKAASFGEASSVV